MKVDIIRGRYIDLLGHVPGNIETRLKLAEAAGRLNAFEAIEDWRAELLHNNPLDRKTQQLVHFALLIGSGDTMPAELHARGALKAGASIRELFGVAETAAVTGGMPAFSRAVRIIAEAVAESAETAKSEAAD